MEQYMAQKDWTKIQQYAQQAYDIKKAESLKKKLEKLWT